MHLIIVGFGNIGKAIYKLLLASGYTDESITIFDLIEDKDKSVYSVSHLQAWLSFCENRIILPFGSNKTQIGSYFYSKKDVVIVCTTPVSTIIEYAKLAIAHKVHFISVTEDESVTETIKSLVESDPLSKSIVVPQCGLAPGLVNILANNYVKQLEKNGTIDALRLRVGALPKSISNAARYSCSWSLEGIENEYNKDCHIIRSSRLYTVPALDGYERLIIDGREFEAFYTSGAIADLLSKKITNLDYKSIRYVGHRDYVLGDTGLDLNVSKLRTTSDDQVIIYIEAIQGKTRKSFTKICESTDELSAIQFMTAFGVFIWVQHLKFLTPGFYGQCDFERTNLSYINDLYEDLSIHKKDKYFLPLDKNGNLL